MTSKPTSFQKKTKSKVHPIPGTKPSIHNAQLLISSGVPSLDNVIGGGIPIGTVMLVEEDRHATFSKCIMKYFLAEGIVCGHSAVAASQDLDPESLVSELPAPVQEGYEKEFENSQKDERMKIAWRYQNMKLGQYSERTTNFGHFYDLNQTMNSEAIKAANVSYWNGSECELSVAKGRFMERSYDHLLQVIHSRLEEGDFFVNTNAEVRNVLRIGVVGIGSPLWGPVEDIRDLCLFLYCLRALLRTSFAVCLLTLPWHLYAAVPGALERFEHLADYVIRLEAWEGDVPPALSEYNGLVYLRKLPAINTLGPHLPESLDLAFRLRRKKFVIQKLHLPPELKESAEREQDDLALPSGCNAMSRKSLDF